MNIETLSKKPEPPERIYNWLNTQMSIARYWGCCTAHGRTYYVSPTEPGAPLVRADVLAREAKSAIAKRRAEKQAIKLAQGELL